MKSFNMPLVKLLKQGLRPYDSVDINGEFLTLCTNAKPTIGGLEAAKYVDNIGLADKSQLFITSVGLFVCTVDKIYQLNESNGSLILKTTVTQIGTYWTYADFGGYIVFANGLVNVIRSTAGVFSTDAGTLIPLASAICNYNGRAIIGNITNYPASGVNKNWIAWSDIGNLAFLKSSSVDQMLRNISGNAPMSWSGSIYQILPLRGGFVVYGSNGITAFYPAIVEGAPAALGKRHLLDMGIKGVKAVTRVSTEDTDNHYFVGMDNNLYLLDRELKVTEIGYKEFISTISAADISLSYLYSKKELIIGGADSYIITKQGMGGVDTEICSAVTYNNTDYVHHKNWTDVAAVQAEVKIKTDIIDFKSSGLKAIEFLSLKGKIDTSVVQVEVQYKDGKSAAWSTSAKLTFNQEGTCRIGVRGIEFIITLYIPNYTTFLLNELELTVQFVDRRFRRGIAIARVE